MTSRRWSMPDRTATAWIVAAIVVVSTLLVSTVAVIGARHARPSPTEPERRALLTATREAVTAVMTYDPAHADRDRAGAQLHLTGLLAQQYRLSGPDLVIPGALQAGATLRADVIGVGVHEFGVPTSAGTEARLLAFVNENVSVPAERAEGPAAGPAALSRWVRMREVDGRWLMVGLRPVGDALR